MDIALGVFEEKDDSVKYKETHSPCEGDAVDELLHDMIDKKVEKTLIEDVTEEAKVEHTSDSQAKRLPRKRKSRK